MPATLSAPWAAERGLGHLKHAARFGSQKYVRKDCIAICWGLRFEGLRVLGGVGFQRLSASSVIGGFWILQPPKMGTPGLSHEYSKFLIMRVVVPLIPLFRHTHGLRI